MTPRQKRGLVIIGLILAPFVIGLLFTFEIIKIPFPTDMADQPSIDYQEGPRILPPEGAVPIQGLSVIPEEFPVNPVPSDEVSLQRGAILYDIHCELCHGAQGQGDGPLAQYFDRTPQNLTTSQISAEFDGSVYLTHLAGFWPNASLAENLCCTNAGMLSIYVHTLPP
jgi:hypothetical protein